LAQRRQDLVRFLLGLRQLLRTSLACAVVTLPAPLIRSIQGGATLLRRLEHFSDAIIELQSFASRPDLAAQFPRYAGLVNIRILPALTALVPPSARLSVLRGTSGKEDLAFRLKRRRFVVETLHLDVDGGVNERRTPKPSEKAAAEPVGKPGLKSDKPGLYDF
jgi:elongator complex protein 4